jgi:hypothetical protein
MLTYVIGSILAISGLGMIIIKLMKGSVAEDLLQNQDVKAKVIDIQTGIAKDQAQLNAEAAARDKAAADLKAKENQGVTKDQLLDFINNNDPNKPSN